MSLTAAEISAIPPLFETLKLALQSGDIGKIEAGVKDLNAIFKPQPASVRKGNRLEIYGVSLQKGIDLSNLEFFFSLTLRRCNIYGANVSILKCEFHETLRFDECTFQTPFSLDHVIAHAETILIGNDFHNGNVRLLNFSGALTFGTPANLNQFELKDSNLSLINLHGFEKFIGKFIVENTTFEEQVVCTDRSFFGTPSKIFFEKCTFKRGAQFELNPWKGTTSFSGSKFHEALFFGLTTFSEPLDLSKCEFSCGVFFAENDTTNFNQDLTFSGSKFLGAIRPNHINGIQTFRNLNISGHLSFEGCAFSPVVRFDHVNSPMIDMSNTTFDRDLFYYGYPVNSSNFSNLASKKNISFKDVRFQNPVDFSKGSAQFADFSNVEFEDDANFDNFKCDIWGIQKTKFQGNLSCEMSDFGTVNGNSCAFESRTTFAGTSFSKAPHFHDVDFFQDTNFHGCGFKDVASSHAVGAYRTLKHAMSNMDNNTEETEFAALELHSRRIHLWSNLKTKKGTRRLADLGELLFSYVYYLINNYGRSLLRPILVWMSMIVLFMGLFSSFASSGGENVILSPTVHSEEIAGTWLQGVVGNHCFGDWCYSRAAYFSVFNSLGPLRLLPTYSVIVATNTQTQILAFIQGIASTALIYVFVVGIKRRFKTLS